MTNSFLSEILSTLRDICAALYDAAAAKYFGEFARLS